MKAKALFIAAILLCLFVISSCQKSSVIPTDNKKNTSTTNQQLIAQLPGDTTITLPVDSIHLRGKSSLSSDAIAGYLWSQISGPNEAQIRNESSPLAYFKGFVVGKYLFQFMVIGKNGLTGIDTVGVIVNPSQTQTLNLSPSNNPYEIALSLLVNQDISNKTSIEEPLAAWTVDGAALTNRNLLKFDLSSIPANSTILSANLYLYSDTIPKNGDLIHANYGNDDSFVIQQVASSWDPATVNWFNQPDGLTSNQVVVPNTTQPFLNVNVDVKTLVAAMVNNNENYGFKLSLVNEVEYTSRIFCSSYYSDASRHPRLIVTYKRN
ncbi:MAG: DNRLRE domain-containing protein [Mucilaginibacter sp.]